MARRRKAPKKSHVIVVLDRSGSMSSIKSDTEGGFDSMIEELRTSAEGETLVTLVQFDTEHETVYAQKTLDDVPKLILKPRGRTALLDGVGEAIKRAEKFVNKGDNVAVTILTDGGENSSREYSKEAVTALMDEKREDGWEFNFVGAGPAAWSGAGLLGIGDSHTINYSGSGAATADAFTALAASNASKTRGGSSSYLASAPELKSRLETEANAQPGVQINIAPGAFPPRKRGSGKDLRK